MNPAPPPVAPFREQTMQWFRAGDTMTGCRHATEYEPESRWLIRLVFNPFVLGLALTLSAGLLYSYLGPL